MRFPVMWSEMVSAVETSNGRSLIAILAARDRSGQIPEKMNPIDAIAEVTTLVTESTAKLQYEALVKVSDEIEAKAYSYRKEASTARTANPDDTTDYAMYAGLYDGMLIAANFLRDYLSLPALTWEEPD